MPQAEPSGFGVRPLRSPDAPVLIWLDADLAKATRATLKPAADAPVHALGQDKRASARLRGMELSAEVAHYVLQRTERSSKGLFALLERLDEHSLQTQRRITIPLVREVFQNETL